MTTYQSGSDRAYLSGNDNKTRVEVTEHSRMKMTPRLSHNYIFCCFTESMLQLNVIHCCFIFFFHRELKACLAYFSAQPSAENILVKTLLMYDPSPHPLPTSQPLHHENILVKTLLMYDPSPHPPPTPSP